MELDSSFVANVRRRMRSAIFVWMIGRLTRFAFSTLVLLIPCASLLAGNISARLLPDQPLIDAWVGFGAHCDAWIYSKPDWGPVSNDKNISDLEQKFIDLGPQHVRVFVEFQKDSPQQKDPQVKASVIRTIQLAGKAGATVNCTFWHGPYKNLGEDTQAMVDIMDDFIRVHHLANIKYVTIQNEPNGHDFNMEKYNTIYREFDARMRKAGLRDQIKIVGGDLVKTRMSVWFRDLAWNLADVCDGYSVHMYCDVWDRKEIDDRIPSIVAITSALPKDRQRPIYMTEFGFRGHREGKEEPGRMDDGRIVSDTTDYGVAYGWRVLDALNHGFVCALSWDGYDAIYDRKDMMHYGLIAWDKGNWRVRPYALVLKLLTHTSKPGWQTIKVDGSNDDVLAAAMRSRDGDCSMYAVNRSGEMQSIIVNGMGFRDLSAWLWNGDGKGGLTRVSMRPPTESGDFRVALPAHSFIAVSTLHPEL